MLWCSFCNYSEQQALVNISAAIIPSPPYIWLHGEGHSGKLDQVHVLQGLIPMGLSPK